MRDVDTKEEVKKDERRIAATFPDHTPFKILGAGTNPARQGSTIYSSGCHAFRADLLEESFAELQQQIGYLTSAARDLAHQLDPRVLFEWKMNVVLFFAAHPSSALVGVCDVRTADDFFVTKMELGACTVKDELLGLAGTTTLGPTLRTVLLDWLLALTQCESSGLTFVDAHLDNFCCFRTADGSIIRKLIDLESLHPLRLLFEDVHKWPVDMPAVPAGYAAFLRGDDEPVVRQALQRFFASVLHHKLKRSLVMALREEYLWPARRELEASAMLDDCIEHLDDLDRVERFVTHVAVPCLSELASGALRPDSIYCELLSRASGPHGLLRPTIGRALTPLAPQLQPPAAAAVGGFTRARGIDHRKNHRALSGPHAALHSGDWAKLFVVIMCFAFLACVLAHEYGMLNVFSPSYLADGFCVSSRHAPMQNSHAISFCADVATALGLVGFVQCARKRGLSEAAIAPLSKNSFSLLGHGVGHLFLAVRMSAGGDTQIFEDAPTSTRLAMYASFMPVWYAFMRDTRRDRLTTIAFTLFHNTLQTFFLSSRFFFTHVLMAVLLGSALRWLHRPLTDKTHYYAMEAWLVDVPILLASFGEALTCDAFLIRWGGHVWFDMVVPVGLAFYYLILVNDVSETTALAFEVSKAPHLTRSSRCSTRGWRRTRS